MIILEKNNDNNKIYASVLVRILSKIIDNIIYLIIFVPISMFFYIDNIYYQIILTFPNKFIIQIYLIIFHTIYGASIGKLILGIRVVKSNFCKINLNIAIKRSSVDLFLSGLISITQIYTLLKISKNNPEYNNLTSLSQGIIISDNQPILAKIISFIALLWIGSKIILPLFDKKIRGPHDILSDTIVVYKKYL